MTLSIEELVLYFENQEEITIETSNSFLLSANINTLRVVLFKDGRALVHGTADVGQARQLYNKLLGNYPT
ncbi:thiamine/molybdopterin biosynthesis MoeB-like protein [compost metagenome]